MDCGKKMKPQVKRSHYFTEHYDKKEHFISYWYQINEIKNLNPKRTLEIGVGNGFVSTYFKKRNFNIKTLDIDSRLTPDVVGSLLDLPFQNDTFDVVACYEVLEHLPFGNFPKALMEIRRISKYSTILSLPDVYPEIRIYFTIPLVRKIKIIFPLPQIGKKAHEFDGQHYWEIGKSGYSLKKIISEINKVGFIINRSYRLFEHPYHRFFILNKS